MLNTRQLWYLNTFLLGIALWLSYKIWVAPRQDAWHFIPDNAFLVIESKHLQKALYQPADTVVSAIETIPFLHDAAEHLGLLAADLDTNARRRLLQDKLISYSLHREAKRNLEYVVYLPLSGSEDRRLVEALLKNPAPDKRLTKQTTQEVEITRIKRATDDSDFACFIYDDFLIGSRSSILLEAVIAKIKSRTPALDKVPFNESRQSYAHLFFRTRNLLDVSDLLPTELSPNLRSYFRNIVPFNPDLVLDKVSSKEYIQGYVASKTKVDVPFLSAFGLQRGSAFQSAQLIPTATSFFIRASFHDGQQLAVPLNVYLKKKDEKWLTRKDSVQRLLSLDMSQLVGAMQREAILCEMETVANEPSQKVALFAAAKPDSLATILDQWATAADRYHAFKSQPFNLLNRLVRKVEIAELPALLFGSTFSGFSECFYTVVGQHVVLANSQQAMSNYLTQIGVGNTWQNSKYHQDLLKKFNKNAQITVVISPQRIWNNIYYSLPERWQQAVLKHEQRFKEMRLLAVENFVHREQFGTKIHIQKNAARSGTLANQLLLQQTQLVGEPLIGQPFVLVNPATRQAETIVQTATGLQLLSNAGSKLGQVPLTGQLHRPFRQIDFRQNGQLQYLTHTSQKLYLLQRTATEFSAFSPESNFSGGIHAVGSLLGKIYVADGAGSVHRLVYGASPVKLPIKGISQRIMALQPVAFKNITYLAILLQDGTVHLVYENDGVSARNFPQTIPFSGRPTQLIVDADSQGKPFLTVLSHMGELKKVTLDGVVLRDTQQLERRSKEAVFSVIFDQQERDWLLVQKDVSGLTLYDKRGNTLLAVNSPIYNELAISFFDLGNDWRLVSIFDGQNTLFYDLKGKQFGDKPLPAAALPYMSFEEIYNKIIIHNPVADKLEKWGIKVQ